MSKGWVQALGTHWGPRHVGSSWRWQDSLPATALHSLMVPCLTLLYSRHPEQEGLSLLGISQLLVVKKSSFGNAHEECISQLWDPRGWAPSSWALARGRGGGKGCTGGRAWKGQKPSLP